MGWIDRLLGRREAAAGELPERYRGRPLLLLLDNYVISVVGALPAAREARLTEITKRTFGGGADWKATLRETLKLDPSVDADIRGMWERNQARAREAGAVLTPEQFARMVVDSNWADF